MILKKLTSILALLVLVGFALPCVADTVTYEYDDLYRLIRATYSDGTVIEYTYDAAGNRLSRVVTAGGLPVSSFCIFATNSVWVRPGAVINSGNIGVQDAGPGPWLNADSELTIGKNVQVADGIALYGDSVMLRAGASVADVSYNELAGTGTIRGNQYTPLSLPLGVSLPAFPTPAPGTEGHIVKKGETLTLGPGAYGEVRVKKNATLILTGGTYHVEDLLAGPQAKILFRGPIDLVINNRLDPGKEAVIGPEDGSGIGARDIRIYVNGINGDSGDLDDEPAAAVVGRDNTVRANIYAPHGTLWIKQGTVAEGAFIGRDVQIGTTVQVDLNSGF